MPAMKFNHRSNVKSKRFKRNGYNGEATQSNDFCLPSKKGFTPKGKNLQLLSTYHTSPKILNGPFYNLLMCP